METKHYLIIAAVFVAAGGVKGISGLGLPTISMALLSLVMPPAKAAMLMLLPSFTIFSPFASIDAAGGHATLLLGLVLVAYGIWGLIKPALPNGRHHVRWVGGAIGMLSGLIAAATGVFVIPLVPYVQSLRLDKEAFIQGLGISFMVATVALAIRLGTANGGALLDHVPGCVLAFLAAFLGLWMGARLRGHMNPVQFQRALYSVFAVLGLIMVGRAL